MQYSCGAWHQDHMLQAASIPTRASLILACMVGGMKIDWANQVWASELANLRMAHVSLGLTATGAKFRSNRPNVCFCIPIA